MSYSTGLAAYLSTNSNRITSISYWHPFRFIQHVTEGNPRTCHNSIHNSEIFKCQYYSIHRNISKNNKKYDCWYHHEKKLMIFFYLFSQQLFFLFFHFPRLPVFAISVVWNNLSTWYFSNEWYFMRKTWYFMQTKKQRSRYSLRALRCFPSCFMKFPLQWAAYLRDGFHPKPVH